MLDLVGLGRKIYPFFFRQKYARYELWFARFFLSLLAAKATPPAIRLLAELHAATHLTVRQLALHNLQKNGGQQHINEVCQVWRETRNETLCQLLYERGWIADQPPELAVLSALQAQRGWFLKPTYQSLVLLTQVIFDEQPELSRRALAYFADFTNSNALAVALKAEPAYPELVQDILAHSDFFQQHAAGLEVVLALHANRPELLTLAGAEVVAPLLELAGSAEKLAPQACSFISALQTGAARDALCELALQEGLEVNLARSLALEAGFYPQDKHARAKFFFLTEQWAKYEALDFDATLMQVVYESADERTRKRISRLGRTAGRPELTKIVGGRKRSVRQLSAEEWELLTQSLLEKQRWAEAFEFAQIAPPIHATTILKALGKANWWPEQAAEQLSMLDLAARAEKLDTLKPPLGRQLKPQAKLKLPLDMLTERTQSAFCPAQGLFATTYASNGVRVWDVKTGDLVANIPANEPLPDGSNLAPDNFVIAQLEISPDGKLVAILDRWQNTQNTLDYRVRLYNLAEKRLWPILFQESISYRTYYYYPGGIEAYFSMKFSPNSKYLAVGNYTQNQGRVWELTVSNDYKLVRTISKLYRNKIGFSADSRRLIYQAANQLTFQSISTGRSESVTTSREYDFYGLNLRYIYPDPSGKYLLTVDKNQTMILWRLQPDVVEVATIGGRHSGVFSVAISPDGTRLATGHSQVVRLWTFPELAPVKTVWSNRLDKAVTGLIFSDNGQSLLSVDEAGNVKTWSTRLAQAANRPTETATQDYLLFARKAQQDAYLPANERCWLEFLEALFAAHTAYDIEISEVAPQIDAGQYDIELEG